MKDDVIKIFRELCSVPHGSGNTKKISDFVRDMALSHGLSVIQDEYNNLILKKPASPGFENRAGIVFQAHLDMVAVKTDGSTKNMLEDGIDVLSDGEFMWANGTSLGADDGIGVATALAIMFDEKLPHPPLEALFTVDEETHLEGAAKVNANLITGRWLINLDSEEEGVFTVSCAGGVSCEYGLEPESEEIGDGYDFFRLVISGLTGGHSGVEIHHGRANANKLMFDVLSSVKDVRICEMRGGTFENVIPKKCSALFALPSDSRETKLSKMREILADFSKKYSETDSGMKYEISSAERAPVLKKNVSDAIISLGLSLPDSVIKFSESIPGFVETSLNLGIVDISVSGVKMVDSIRSSVSSEKARVLALCMEKASKCGVKATKRSEYPEWQYAENSVLRDRAVSCYKELFGKEPVVSGVHAGLECGILSEKLPGLDAISIGPNIYDVHSVNERLDLRSVERMYELVEWLVVSG